MAGIRFLAEIMSFVFITAQIKYQGTRTQMHKTLLPYTIPTFMIRYLDMGIFTLMLCCPYCCLLWQQILTSFLVWMITRKCWSSSLFPVYVRDQEWPTKVSSAVKCEVAVGCCFTDASHTQLQIKKILSSWNSSYMSFIWSLILLKLWIIRNVSWGWGRSSLCKYLCIS